MRDVFGFFQIFCFIPEFRFYVGTVVLRKEEWQALYCNVNRVSEPTADPPSLREAVLWIAKLGGFLARKSDGDPGPQVLWCGFQYLPYITDMFLIMRRNE